jgi:hypothetical protein
MKMPFFKLKIRTRIIDIVILYCDDTVGVRTTNKIRFSQFRIYYIHLLRHNQ